MTKLECWKLNSRSKVGTNWIKLGKYTPTNEPLVDVRQRTKNKADGYRLETFSIGGNRKYYEVFKKRKDAEKRAIEVMKKHDKCIKG